MPKIRQTIDQGHPCPIALAKAVPGRIVGTVVDPVRRVPVRNAKVAVLGSPLSTKTGADGTYTLTGVPSGPVRVSVIAPGHVAATRPATVTANQTVTLDFGLVTVVKGPKPRPLFIPV